MLWQFFEIERAVGRRRVIMRIRFTDFFNTAQLGLAWARLIGFGLIGIGIPLADQFATAQEAHRLIEPIYRVAHEAAAGQTTQVASRIEHVLPQTPFDLNQRASEHPLMPALRIAQQCLQSFDQNFHDYNATLIKQERIAGVLGDQEAAFIKVRNHPSFDVYMFFLKPHRGQECLYKSVTKDPKGMLYARGSGMTKRLGVMELPPDSRLAMRGQKYPITKLGLRKLITELIEVAENDVKFGECDVRTAQSQINKRSATLIEVVHPVQRNNFRFHKAELFIDNELKIPIRYAAYLWPDSPGGQPPLEEAYTYLNLKINNGYTDIDFDRNNPEYFK